MREWLNELSEIDLDCVLQYELLLGRQLTGYDEYHEIDSQVNEMILEWETPEEFFEEYPSLEKYKGKGDRNNQSAPAQEQTGKTAADIDNNVMAASIGREVYLYPHASHTCNLDTACILVGKIEERNPKAYIDEIEHAATIKVHFTEAIAPDGVSIKADKTMTLYDSEDLYTFSLKEAKEKAAAVYAKIRSIKVMPQRKYPSGPFAKDYFAVVDFSALTDHQLLAAKDLAKEFVGPQSAAVHDITQEMVRRFEEHARSAPEIYQDHLLDFSKLVFRDHDDTGMPLQFFFGYEGSRKEIRDLASSLGYKGELCTDIEICLDLYDPSLCPLEVVLTFDDHTQCWDDFTTKHNYLDRFIDIVRNTDSERAHEALHLYEEFIREPAPEDIKAPSVVINREKLQRYIEDEMIIEFSSPEACLIHFNTYDGQNFRTVSEMKAYQAEYGFGLDGKWYHISFDEALDVREKPSLESQIQSASTCSKSPGNTNNKPKLPER